VETEIIKSLISSYFDIVKVRNDRRTGGEKEMEYKEDIDLIWWDGIG
jgi:hypothetical protein